MGGRKGEGLHPNSNGGCFMATDDVEFYSGYNT